MSAGDATVTAVEAEVYDVPTDQPDADGTLSWKSTTMIVVRVHAGPIEGLGWTYAGGGVKTVVDEKLADVVVGGDALSVPAHHEAMVRAVRNLGRPGLAACAVSAVDIALWDLKARCLELPLADLWGRVGDEAAVYGSGGFTTYDDDTTVRQLESWVGDLAIPRVKIKIGESWGTRPERDLARVALSRQVVGPDVALYVDANGAYSQKQAIRLGRVMSTEYDVTWFEEPVSSDDLAGLRVVRDHCDADVAAGEYGYTPDYFAKLIGSVDCVQVDVTRCGGYTDWFAAAHLAAVHNRSISAHCAPNLHAHSAVCISNLRHIEYFHDHTRIESALFDGVLSAQGGVLRPDSGATGHGMTLRRTDAERYRSA